MTFSFQSIILVLTSLLIFGCASFSESRSCSFAQESWGDTTFQVDVISYKSDANATKTLVLVPPTGGTNCIDRSYAKKFCKAGYHAIILNHWTGEITHGNDLELHQNYYRSTQQAISLILEHVNTSYIGMLGTSLGGLHASVAAAYQPKLDSVFVIVGGIPIASVIVNSDQKAMVNLRQSRRERYGFTTADENIQAIEKVFPLDPKFLGDSFKKKDLGLVVSTTDTTVPAANQKNLQNYWQPKTVITMESSHFWSIVKTWLFHSDEVLDFFEKSARTHLKK